MSDQIVIRTVTQEDFPAWKPLWDGYNAFYGREGEPPCRLKSPEPHGRAFSMSTNPCTPSSQKVTASYSALFTSSIIAARPT